MQNRIMKKRFQFLIFTTFFCCFVVQAQTAIPDTNFENYLETHSADGAVVIIGDANSMGDGMVDGFVPTDRISDVTTLNLVDLDISDLTGIEDFTGLEVLVCNNNRVEQVDVSNNANLTLLNVSNNRITGELIVSNNTNLESLFCSSNQISILNLSTNTVLKNLDASNNILTSLDLTNINTVACPNPQTNPPTLCQGSSTINVSRNNLNDLVVANGFNDLLIFFDSSGNSDLFCIQIDTGFTPNGWVIDFTYFSDVACVDIFTYVPDDNFEQALINQGLDDVLDNFVLRMNISTLTDLDVSNSSILSLEGIEDFIALENLDISSNSIEQLDVSNNTALLQLNVSDNNLTDIDDDTNVFEKLDLSNNTALLQLNVSNNNLSELDVSNNVALNTLNCSGNIFINLNLQNNTLLEVLDCSFNQIENLNLTLNTVLSSISCSNNNLFALSLANGNNVAIMAFDATNNANLFCIQVDDAAFSDAAAGWLKDASASYNLDCGTYIPDDNFEQYLIDQGIDTDGTLNNFVPTVDISSLTDLDVSNLAIADLTGIEDFAMLGNLNCSGNMLSVLNLENNTAISILDASNNQIESLNLTANINLTSLLCNDNLIETLNIKNGNNNLLTTFNATINPRLFCINVDDAILANIPMTWQKDDIADYNGDCENSRFTTIPDTFFEQALIDLDLDTVIDGVVLTSNIEQIQILNISDSSILDLTGIKDFKLLEELDCNGNFLEDLDVSELLFLKRINCNSNAIDVLNINDSVNITDLFCAGNNIENLDTTQLDNLLTLDCSDNNISTLDLTNNILLTGAFVSNNSLTNLDISANADLKNLDCSNNQINNLVTSASPNTTLINLNCANNDLSAFDITNYQGLITLNCSSNTLNQLDVSGNTSLEVLNFLINQLTTIDLVNNVNLVELFASQNSLTQLDVTSNTLIENIDVSFNDLQQLILNTNVTLKYLALSNNQLTTLDLSNNSNLIEADFSSNQLVSLVLSANLGSLKTLNASSNQIEGNLDLTTFAISACTAQPDQTEFCPNSISINISNNLFEGVNLQNGINPDITLLNTTSNPNLDCIQIDDISFIGTGWQKDSFTEYNEDCNFGETFVPDDNFEQALIDLGLDVAPLNDYVLTANIEGLLTLDVSGNAITDLIGVEDFAALETLNVSTNNLSTIDLSNNDNLIDLNVSNNQFLSLDVSNNLNLSTLNCSNNSISNLDLDSNINLSNLNISNNLFTSFLPSEIPSLEVFNCEENTITELDFQQNQLVTDIYCSSNLLEVLTVKNTQNDILLNLDAQNNPNLDCIETDTGTVPAGATWLVDTDVDFAVDCFYGQTFVPDDNFEQFLINSGFDSGTLDDYVPTQNINSITNLDISEQAISDLTGIEDFIALTDLDFEINSVTLADLSNNTALINLNASMNLLQDLDISNLSNLVDLNISDNQLTTINLIDNNSLELLEASNNQVTTLDVSNNTNLTLLNFPNNQLATLNLTSNTGLVNIDVSNNSLTALNVDTLINLEELNCNVNFISSLSVTQNINLTVLFCQSNAFIADQLNLQNGNNQNIQTFNATDNPDLACVLVDNPPAVLNNFDGFYDNWNIDNTAAYQVVCIDADNDGVPNVDDQCPGTIFGTPVDLFGCPFPDLSNNNFAISILSETCQNANDGHINIVSQQLYAYTVTLTGNDFFQEYNFTNDIDILNLLAGTYEMCITIEEWPDYEVCYTIVITEPNALEVFSSRVASGSRIALDMSGSISYNIEFNNETFTTFNPALVLDLKEGINTLRVSTDLDCQGVFEEVIFNTKDFVVSPNPFTNILKINNVVLDENITVNIYSMVGKLVYNKTYFAEEQQLDINTNNIDAGLYIISIQSKTRVSTYKIIKQ